jgi:hypothetical protein
MPTKSAIGNLVGSLSVLGSISFWILFVLRTFLGLHKIDPTIGQFAAIWIGAVVLALLASLIGSKRWAYAALLPLVNFLFAILVINLMEWHR